MIEDLVIIKVDPRDGIRTRRNGWLFDDFDDCVAIKAGNAILRGVGDLFEQNAGAVSLLAVGRHFITEVVGEDIVTQDDHYRTSAREVFAESQGLSDSARLILHTVGKVESPAVAAAQEGYDIAHVFGAGYYSDLLDARLTQPMERVIDHGVAPDWQQVLIGHLCQGIQAAARSSGQYDTFKRCTHGVCEAREEAVGRTPDRVG